MRRVLVFDCETGGLDPSRHGLTQIAAAVFEYDESWKLRGRLARLAVTIQPEPGMAYEDEALDLQHRTMADLEAGVPVSEAVESLRAMVVDHFGAVKRCAPVAHNASFDKSFLDAAVVRLGVEHPTNHCWRCTMQLWRWMQDLGLHECYRANMDAILSNFGIAIPAESRHTADGDVNATALVLSRMMALLKPVEVAAR